MKTWCFGTYVDGWERFAGKPYVKPTNKPSGPVIRNTVSQAQDTLYRLKLGRESRRAHDSIWSLYGVEKFYGGENYPQSLGELCIELAQDKAIWRVKIEDPLGMFDCERLFINLHLLRDIQELRRVMWHKHTDPKMERLDRLIDLVRTA